MLTNINLVRPTSGYPYQGHNLICNDIAGIADWQEVVESALSRISQGNPEASGSMGMAATYPGAMFIPGSANANYWLAERPVIGMSSGIGQYPVVPNTPWTIPAVFEIVPQFYRFAITVTFRLLGKSQFTFRGLSGYEWPGSLASYFDITLGSWYGGGVQTQLVQRFYKDLAYYTANVPLIHRLPTTPQDIDLATAVGVPEGDFKQFTILGTLAANMSPNLATITTGTLSFGLCYPLNPFTEALWSAPNVADGTTTQIEAAPHPLTGINYACDGLADFQVYFFR